MPGGYTLNRLLCNSNILFFFIALLTIVNLSPENSFGMAVTDSIPSDPAIIQAGQTLFKNNCAVCHNVQQQVVGPALKSVYERRTVPWIINFVHSSQKVIQGGDAYAVKLYEQFNKTQMPNFDFKDEEIISVIAYIKHETLNPPQVAVAATNAAAGTEVPQAGIGRQYLIAILAGLVVILLLILIVLLLLVTTLTKFLKQKTGLDEAEREILEQRFDLGKLIRAPGFVFLIAFIFITILAKAGIDGLYSIGIQQGYSPTQPIAYSHKLHAGQYGIQCQYCHTGVMTSKSANIPSANICMNCHSQITVMTGKTEKSVEIQKIYDAIQNDKPIEWVRIDNLPDLAYFNHSQHYNVGGITCQTCHGPIETMEVVKQYTNLTMGWCIDCHRKTAIKSDNPYYDKLVEIHKRESKIPMTAKDIGGLECSKCHY
jgi:mono/diheme cytochrome c family protein